MIRRPGLADSPSRLVGRYAAAACLGLGLACLGCGKSDPPAGGSDGGSGQASSSQSSDPSDRTAGGSSSASSASEPASPAAAAEVLRRMADAYKAAPSYADAGRLNLTVNAAGGSIDESYNFATTLVRPNKIRLEIYELMAVSDGRTLHAAIEDLPGQVVERPVPPALTVQSLFADPIMGSVVSGAVGPSPAMALLMEDDPLPLLIDDMADTTLVEPGTIAGHECYRVETRVGAGILVFWVDKESYVLRRIVFPTDGLRRQFAARGPVESVALVADFEGARLGGEVDPTAFAFEVPADARLARFFVEPDPAQLLGKKAPDYRFVDLEGNPVTPESLAGKAVLLKFWATWCQPCRDSFPMMEKVRQQYVGDSRIAFVAVSVDRPDVGNEELRDAMQQWGAAMPIARDPNDNMARFFNTESIPTSFLIDAKGTVQYTEQGFNPLVANAADLVGKIDEVLAGHDVYQEPLEDYQNRMKQRERQIEALIDPTSAERAPVTELEIPRATIAPRSEPATFTLTRVWECAELTSPGNILVIGEPDGRPRLLVADAGSAVAEVGLDGKLIASHRLNLAVDPATQRPELVTNLRTAVGADNRRYVAAVASGQQRFHLLDAAFNQVLSYPADALENRHSGIADVQLADLNGDGTIEAAVGYWGPVGVQAVSLTGTRLWPNRSLENVERIAVLAPDAQGRRQLLCASSIEALVLIDSDGQRIGELPTPGRVPHGVVAADLTGDGQPELCALAAAGLGENVAIGLDLRGKVLWDYALPLGVFQRPVEPIVAGRLAPGEAGQWLLPAADGSIHVLAADGRPIEHFNYGASLAGLATVDWDGTRLLIVATGETLEAWRVEPVGGPGS